MTTVLLVIMTILAVNAIIVAVFFYIKSKKVNETGNEQPSEPVSNPEPTEPEQSQEPVSEPKFKEGDWVCNNNGQPMLMCILRFNNNEYSTVDAAGLVGIVSQNFLEDHWHLWTIEDAKDGDVLVGIDDDFTSAPWMGIFKCINKDYPDRMFDSHCYIEAGTHTFTSPDMESHYENPCVGHSSSFVVPATKEQSDLLFSKMEEAGYTWDAETKTLSKKEEPQEPETLMEEQKEEELPTLFDDLIVYFGKVVNIPKDGKTYSYLKSMYEKFINDGLLDKGNFPTPCNYWGEKDNDCWIEQGNAKLLANILSELVPDKAELLQQMGYDYPIKGADQPTYGWNFLTDPNVNRDVADVFYSANKDIDLIPKLREELGSKMVSYKNDVSELFIDNTKWMPSVPAPYLKDYSKRKNLPVDGELTAKIDEEINEYVAKYYSLDTKNAELRQATIQAIANKEYKIQHLFGKPRTVTDPKYGTMTFNPVFGVHNIGIEIDPNGKIADLCYTIGRICSDSRKPLLDQEYGRRRPGQGDIDPSANKEKESRALVNHPIEEGDGHTTGYYNQNGDYVDNNGTHIGDYETYFQGQLYANSYPSGHSAFIKGVAMVLTEIMPDRADKILKAMNEFAISRTICRYHHMSDTIHGRVIGGFMVPVLCACTNLDFDKKLKEAREEYKNGYTPQPTEKVNTSLAYSIGGYGSCHVDAGETAMIHCCTKQCTKERHPSITVNQKVEFTLEGGITTDDGKTSGLWEANGVYGIKCPAVKEDKYAYITMRNENGVKVCQYRLSKDGTHDDGPADN